MRKQYISPRSEDIQFEPLMVDYFLGIASVSGGAATVSYGEGA